MKSTLLAAGIVGLLVGWLIYWGGSFVSSRIPILVQSHVGAAIMFAVLLALSVTEMPLMVFGLRQMARRVSAPQPLLFGTYFIYVTFASVYAAVFVLATGLVAWGLALAALALARFASGVLVK
jgi:hypothetical protein